MKLIPIIVDAFETKSHLEELFRKVGADRVVRITQHGKPVADLMPMLSNDMDLPTVAAQKMLFLMKGVSVQAEIDIKFLINAGRDI
ncbi:type II toxin-antitoxin system prevent-host-death family antitoxin [Polynucleobacter sp. AP-Elch-400A-B2]|uniref:type II toxin-antitoxin system Phd/YefM family antitoxin n=1 Tax=Polynucleobacter sp. AP-Elch-400A-B2 TaxID=2576930 RepID=UPI001BFD8764|nr:type II toxin-antitoxin system prevent-host-death family antitoxin [Polynucleobacter sp. AP-Elch-400A-B2]QWE24795.1 type II toxin-antitoxin system prevent-host-death family antitoxin [Polynucleobacter sp. AP-Elch-400A-B2]